MNAWSNDETILGFNSSFVSEKIFGFPFSGVSLALALNWGNETKTH
jgi:hypothetical protein